MTAEDRAGRSHGGAHAGVHASHPRTRHRGTHPLFFLSYLGSFDPRCVNLTSESENVLQKARVTAVFHHRFFFFWGGGGIRTTAMSLFPLESLLGQSGGLWAGTEGPEAYLQITSFMRVGGRISQGSHLSGPNPPTWVRDRRRGAALTRVVRVGGPTGCCFHPLPLVSHFSFYVIFFFFFYLRKGPKLLAVDFLLLLTRGS